MPCRRGYRFAGPVRTLALRRARRHPTGGDVSLHERGLHHTQRAFGHDVVDRKIFRHARSLDVVGDTAMSNFALNVSGNPMPLTTHYVAVVDGTNGDTYLTSVEAHLGRSTINTSGEVVGVPGVPGRIFARRGVPQCAHRRFPPPGGEGQPSRDDGRSFCSQQNRNSPRQRRPARAPAAERPVRNCERALHRSRTRTNSIP